MYSPGFWKNPLEDYHLASAWRGTLFSVMLGVSGALQTRPQSLLSVLAPVQMARHNFLFPPSLSMPKIGLEIRWCVVRENLTKSTTWERPELLPIDDIWVSLLYVSLDISFYHVGTHNGTTLVSENIRIVDADPDDYTM